MVQQIRKIKFEFYCFLTTMFSICLLSPFSLSPFSPLAYKQFSGIRGELRGGFGEVFYMFFVSDGVLSIFWTSFT